MTNTEAISILTNTADYLARLDKKGFDEARKELREAISMATDAMKKQEEYKWHDLRKNPEDLPEDSENVLVCYIHAIDTADGCMLDKWYGVRWVDYDTDYCPIAAWREIEPFEEDKS